MHVRAGSRCKPRQCFWIKWNFNLSLSFSWTLTVWVNYRLHGQWVLVSSLTVNARQVLIDICRHFIQDGSGPILWPRNTCPLVAWNFEAKQKNLARKRPSGNTRPGRVYWLDPELVTLIKCPAAQLHYCPRVANSVPIYLSKITTKKLLVLLLKSISI